MEPAPQRQAEPFYPEIMAGGFSRSDGMMEFYGRVNALLRPEMDVLDFGAGRGYQQSKTGSPYRSGLANLKGKVARVVAVDVDPAVLQNQYADETHVIVPGQPLPFPDASFDLIVSDWVIEHLDDPAGFEREVRRVLRPGGWLAARTPNKWGLTGLGARLIPHRYHAPILGHLNDQRTAADVFPVRYRMNTMGAIRHTFAASQWRNASYLTNYEPPYVRRWPLVMALVFLYWRLVPTALFTNLHVFVQKR